LTSNLLIKNYTHELERKQARLLSEAVSGLENSPDAFWSDREELYFLLEPFAREYKEFNEEPKHYEYSGRKKWVADALRNIHKPPKALKKYRATLFAWLSYYYPRKAAALNDSMGVSIPLYEGHPDLTDCSKEAKELFRKQPRIKPETAAPPIPPEADISENDDAEPLEDDAERLEKEPSRVRPFAVIAGVALLFASVGAFAFYYVYGSGQSVDSEEAMSSPIDGAPLTAANTDTDDLENDKPEVTEKPKDEPQDAAALSENDNEQTGLSTEQTRQVDAVWDDISAHEWSTKVLRYFYPFVRRANRSDLLRAAKNGNRNARSLAAIGYHSGDLGKVDHGLEIRQYLRPACAAGEGRACTLLGVHYRANWGVERSNATAANFYGQGCRLGNQMGCHYEAVRYYRGEGVAQDIPRAIATFRRTCDAGVAYSCWYLAVSHAQGASVEQNMDLARQYYERSRQLEKPDTSPPFDQVFRPVPAQ